jgi:1-acyl-sn-glycerol-3-phosphate acyltransferase
LPQVEGLENLPPKGETVLVCANHMSWYDVPVLHGFLGGRLLWSFAKAELVNVPVLGTYMTSAEHILISRESRKSQLESLKSAIKTLGLRRDVFIFPEGTRSLDGQY